MPVARDWGPSGFMAVGGRMIRENGRRHMDAVEGVAPEAQAMVINAMLDAGSAIVFDGLTVTRAEVDRPDAVLLRGFDTEDDDPF